MELPGMAVDTLMSAPFRSAYRALGLVCLSVFVASSLPNWIRLSLHISPILAMLLVISVIYLQGQFWKKYSSDLSVTFFRIIFNAAFYFNKLRRDFSQNNNNNDTILEGGQRAAGSFLRVIVFLTMAQHCLTTVSSHMVWLPLHLFLAYRFLVDYIHLAYTKLLYAAARCRRTGTVQEEGQAGGTAPPPTNTTNADHTNNAEAAASNREHQQGSSYKTTILHLGCHTLKLLYVAATLHYGFSQINGHFILVTGIYFVLARHYIEETVIKFAESLQLDLCEGLEQYYMSGFLGLLEILLSMTFMVWSLILRRHMLMFLALYTNIYQRGQEIRTSTFNAAMLEWTHLAQFERATKAELSAYDDVCAVCLCPMRSARKTPCAHYFHGHCLRRCLKERESCPLCNTHIGL